MSTIRPPVVLVVDDDDFARETLQDMLAHSGVPLVHQAGNGRKALRALEALQNTPDLLICDIYMPDMDGFEFLAELTRQKYRGRIVLVSGISADSLSLARDFAQGMGLSLAGAYLKPLTQAQLTQALQPGH